MTLRQAAIHPGLIDPACAGDARAKLEALLPQLEADPWTCPRCGCPMRILSRIDGPAVKERILCHLKVWDQPERPPPPPPSRTLDYEFDGFAWEDAR